MGYKPIVCLLTYIQIIRRYSEIIDSDANKLPPKQEISEGPIVIMMQVTILVRGEYASG